MPRPTPDAQIFISPGCPHCPIALQGLTELVKSGAIGRLDVVNVMVHNDIAASEGVRSAPTIRLGPFTLEGAQTPEVLKHWAQIAYTPEGETAYIEDLLKGGRLDGAIHYVEQDPDSRLPALLPLIADVESPIQVRLGADAILENFQNSVTLKRLVPDIAQLTEHDDARIRTDACHYLALTGDTTAIPYLEACLQDDSDEVKEVAKESLEQLQS